MEATKTIHRAHRMEELEDVLGELHSIEEGYGWIIALIGKIPVFLPEEMAARLKELVGRRIEVLRYEGYRLRVL